VESHGVRAQDEHLISTPNEWTNRESGLGYPTIPKKLCGNISTTLGGPFGISWVFLQQFGAFGNMGHPLSNGDGQVTNYAYDLGCTWATPKWCEWGSVNGHILDEKRWCLWKITKANLEKAHKQYKDFADKPWWEVNFEEGNEVWLNIKKFRLREGLNQKNWSPYVGPFKVLEKKFFDTYKVELLENLKVHPIFHVSFLKWVTCDASRPNREHNSRPPSNFIDVATLTLGSWLNVKCKGPWSWECV
jgi:hypothetical protein